MLNTIQSFFKPPSCFWHALAFHRFCRMFWITATSSLCVSLMEGSRILLWRWRLTVGAVRPATPVPTASSPHQSRSHPCTSWPTWQSRSPVRKRRVRRQVFFSFLWKRERIWQMSSIPQSSRYRPHLTACLSRPSSARSREHQSALQTPSVLWSTALCVCGVFCNTNTWLYDIFSFLSACVL